MNGTDNPPSSALRNLSDDDAEKLWIEIGKIRDEGDTTRTEVAEIKTTLISVAASIQRLQDGISELSKARNVSWPLVVAVIGGAGSFLLGFFSLILAVSGVIGGLVIAPIRQNVADTKGDLNTAIADARSTLSSSIADVASDTRNNAAAISELDKFKSSASADLVKIEKQFRGVSQAMNIRDNNILIILNETRKLANQPPLDMPAYWPEFGQFPGDSR